MASELLEFRWSVPIAGYQWREGEAYKPEGGALVGEGRKEDFLVPVPTKGFRSYDPLREHPALFRTFAEVQPTKEGVAIFAAKYGSLGKEHLVRFAKGPGASGERLADWRVAIPRIRRAVHLWSLIQANDLAGLQKLITWKESDEGLSVRYEDSAGWAEIASWRSNQEWLGRFDKRDLLSPAKLQFIRLVNAEEGAVSRLLIDPETFDPVLKTVPGNLLGCLWLQLAESSATNKEQARCFVCGQWFEKTQFRTDKKTCSAACRNRMHRQRQEQAQQMKAEGKTVKQIASALETDTDTIKNWLKQKKG